MKKNFHDLKTNGARFHSDNGNRSKQGKKKQKGECKDGFIQSLTKDSYHFCSSAGFGGVASLISSAASS